MGVGERGKGYYHTLLGDHWLLVALNGEHVRPEQTAWLQALLPQHPTRHILAMVHHPFLATPCASHSTVTPMDWPGDSGMGQFVKVLEQYGCEIYLCGHCHSYSRSPRLIRNPFNLREPTVSERGMREFIVGTGGVKPMVLGPLHRLLDGSRTPDARTITGVRGPFELQLYPDRYKWTLTEMLSTGLGAVRDSGEQLCRQVLATV
jgi:hypothetical protein